MIRTTSTSTSLMSTSSSTTTTIEESETHSQCKLISPNKSSHESSPHRSPVVIDDDCKKTVESLKKYVKAQEWEEVNHLLRVRQNAHSLYFSASPLNSKNNIIDDQDKEEVIVRFRDEDGWNIFEFAIANRAPLDILQSLISIGGVEMLFEKDCNHVNNSPLHIACDKNDSSSDVIQWILRTATQSLKQQTSQSEQPQCLAEKQAQCKRLLWQKNKFGFTPLHTACSSGLPFGIIKEMITFGGKGLILETNNKGQNALHLACSCSDISLEVIKFLIQIGCDGSNGASGYIVRRESNDGRNALHISYMNRAPFDVIKYLLEMAGKDILCEKNNVKLNHLQLACINSVSDEVIQHFVQFGGKKLLLQNNHDYEHPLLLACEYGTSIQVVESFFTIMNGGMANELIMQRNQFGENALHILCKYGSSPKEVEKYIARIGGEAMIKQRNHDGHNALHLTCMSGGDIEMMKFFLDVAGDTISLAKDYTNGYNSLHILCRNNFSFEAVKLLLDAGGNEILVATDDNGNTPLHIACDCLKPNLINFLVQKSNLKVISSVNNQDRTPLDLLLSKERPLCKDMEHIQTKWSNLDPSGNSMPTKTNANILLWARHLQDSDLELALEYGLIKAIMNKNFIHPFNIALLMADLYIQLAIVVVYSFLIHPTITGEASSTLPRNILFVAFAWSAFREVRKMFRNKTMYLMEPLNYADLVQLVLIMWSALLFDGGGVSQTERIVYTLATGVSCLQLLIGFGNISYPIAVFIIALIRIFCILIPFLVSTFIIVLSFAHMFYMWSISSRDTCIFDKDVQNIPIDWTCNLSSSYAQTFSILITSNWSFLDDEAEGFQTTISYAFAFIVGILLLNILIAIINDSFSDIKRSGEKEYWRYRLNFEDETQRLYHVVVSLIRVIRRFFTTGLKILFMKDPGSTQHLNTSASSEKKMIERPIDSTRSIGERTKSMRDFFFKEGSNKKCVKGACPRIPFNIYSSFDFNDPEADKESINFFKWWFNSRYPCDWQNLSSADVPVLKVRLWYFFNRASWEEIIFAGPSFENILIGIKYNEEGSGMMFVIARVLSQILMLVNVILIIGIFLAGLITFGLCWPSKMKKKLFYGPTETENKKIEIVQLKSQMSHEMSAVQEEVAEMKTSLKIMSEKQDELMKTILTNQAQFAELLALLKKSQEEK